MQKANSPKRGPGKAANRKAALSAQQTIPYLVMHPDGVCQLPGGLYTKTVEYEGHQLFRGFYRGSDGDFRWVELVPQLL